MIRQILATGLLFAAFMNSASAHPGHGSTSNQTGVLHYLTSPMHLGIILLCVAAAIAVWRIVGAMTDRSDSTK